MKKFNKIRYDRKYIPIILIEVYLLFTLFLYLLGPFEYNDENVLILFLLVMVYQVALFCGYFFASKKKTKKIELGWKIIIDSNKSKIIFVALLFTCFYAYMTLVRYCDSFSFIDIFGRVIESFTDPKNAYLLNMELNVNEQIGGSLLTMSSTLLSSFYFIGMPLGIYYYKELNFKLKFFLIITIVLEILSYVIKGTNIGIFKTGIIILVIWALSFDFNKLKTFKFNTFKTKMGILIISLMIVYFAFVVTSRMQSGGNVVDSLFHIMINHDNFILIMLPTVLILPVLLTISYLSQGYHGLALSLGASFTTTYGIGSSVFLMENFSQLFGLDIFSRTYQAKIDMLWSSRVNWHTFYTWVANDVSFIGVIGIMFLLGYIIYKVCYDAYINRNVFAICLMPLYVLLILFIPANNFIISNPLTFMPFLSLHLLWGITKHFKKRRRRTI